MRDITNFDVVIFPTYDQQVQFQKKLSAQNPKACFGKSFHVPRTYVQELWELYGSENQIAQNMETLLLTHKVCTEMKLLTHGQAFTSPEAMQALLGNTQGFPTLFRALKQDEDHWPKSITNNEAAVLVALRMYFQELHSARLVELEEAKLYLKAHVPQHVRDQRILVMGDTLTTDEAYLLLADGQLGQVTFDSQPNVEGVSIQPAPQHLNISYAFSSGGYATGQVLLEVVKNLAEGGGEAADQPLANTADAQSAAPAGTHRNLTPAKNIVITSPEPLKTFRSMERALNDAGFAASVQDTIPLRETEMGRFLIQTTLLSHPELATPGLVSQVAFSVHSGLKKLQAIKLDAAIRGDRLMTAEHAIELLRAQSGRMCKLLDCLVGKENRIIFRTLRMSCRNAKRPESWKTIQENALESFMGYMDGCKKFDLDLAPLLKALDHASVKATIQAPAKPGLWEQLHGEAAGIHGEVSATPSPKTAGAAATSAAPHVLFCSQNQAKLLEPGTIDTVIAADLSQANYPVTERKTAGMLLMEKLGCTTETLALPKARLTFNILTALPTNRLVLHRCLHDASAEEENPALVMEEFADCYRENPTDTDDVDNIYRLPEHLQAGMTTRGEEDFQASTTEDLLNPSPLVEEAPADHALIRHTKGLILPRRVDGQELPGVILSPSRIDAYNKCPHNWFIQQRLGISGLDEELDALAKGSFAHEALQRFYPAYTQATGHGKLIPEDLPQARSIMASICDQLLTEQEEREPGDNRLLAVNAQEQKIAQELKDQVIDYLDYEAEILPGFTPTYFEYEIPAEDAVDYAGVKITGSVDRIDVDAQGRAVIIDYKGGVSENYSLKKLMEGEGSLQALIYAGVIQRKLGLQVIGTIYISYKKGDVAGAYDGSIIEGAHLPTAIKGCTFYPMVNAASATHDGFEEKDGEGSAEGDTSPGPKTFQDLIDLAEDQSAALISRMMAGHVEPTYSEAACAYCPRTSCPERK